MNIVILSVIVLVSSALLTILLRRTRIASLVGSAGGILGSAIGFAGVLLSYNDTSVVSIPWIFPGAAFLIGIDPVSCFFLLPVFVLSAIAAFYGHGYLTSHNSAQSRTSWFHFNLLVASMVMVVIARNGFLFLVAWEVMSLSSLFLVLFHSNDHSVRNAGWIYGIATHIGSVFLIFMFLLAGTWTGSYDLTSRMVVTPAAASVLFILAIIGFGCKAGFMPMHVWLPEAHPAAPSHVSALMSGVMIKMGIYGIIRICLVLDIQAWWGGLLIVIGLTSGIGGVLLALCQHDIKRLLAYHSVENIGIIALGLGLGILGACSGSPFVACAGFGGAMMHVVNHAFFKGLLFLGAGSLKHSLNSTNIESMGGLLKKMPLTGISFLTGSIAICGLPPLNGFVSEFLIFSAGFAHHNASPFSAAITGMFAFGGLALIGGLALACFTKAFGIIFLGMPRKQDVWERGHDPHWTMLVSKYLLCAACIAIGIAPWAFLPYLLQPLTMLTSLESGAVRNTLQQIKVPFLWTCALFLLFCGLATLLFLIKTALLRKREIRRSCTWDCGYAMPTSRMQYSASSFAQPVVDFFTILLRPSRHRVVKLDLFPIQKTGYETHVKDASMGLYKPLFAAVNIFLAKFRFLQGGRVHMYVMYIVIAALVTLLVNLL